MTLGGRHVGEFLADAPNLRRLALAPLDEQYVESKETYT